MSETTQTKVVPSTFATYVRGGTSKAVFVHEKDIPPPGPVRDEFLIRVMGAPDPNEIDGMGGARIVTSKVAIIRPSERDDADVDYTFAQIGLGEATVAYSGNCGNISSGVGPFAINEGMLKTENFEDGNRVVRIFNTGMKVVLIAHVPINKSTGRALEKGDYAISGCPGTGAPILMDYSQTAKPENVQPTGHVIDQLDCSFGTVDATYCKVGNPIAFVDADKLGITGAEKPEEINSNAELVTRVKEVRGRVAGLLGHCTDWTKVDEQSPMLPMIALVSKPTTPDGDVQSRLMLDNHCHQSMAGTGGVCTAAVSRIPGSVVNRLLSEASLASKTLRIQHPAGYLPVQVATEESGGAHGLPVFKRIAFVRTARYLMQGQLFVPEDMQADWSGSSSNNPIIVEESAHSKATATCAGVAEPGHEPQVKEEHDVDGAAGTVNGKIEKTAAAQTSGDDVTTKFIEFTANTQFSDLTPEAESRLRQCLLDFIGVGGAGSKIAETSPHFLQGIKAVTEGFPTTHAILGDSSRFPPQYAALLNGAFAHSLDFDDTHTGGIIHVGATILGAIITEAQGHPELSYQDFLVAMAIGYEIACRVALGLGVSSWHRGFHNTSVAGIFGAVAAIGRLRNFTIPELTNAFGLAVSFASGSMQYLENGSWNKRLHPAKAAHDAFLVLSMAKAGVLGATKPIEGKFGLIFAHTDEPRTAVKVDNLGSRWEFINTGLKPYPACRVTHTSIELAAILGEANKGRAVSKINIIMDPACYPIVGIAAPNKVHAQNVVDAQFSAFYQAACAWLHGDGLGWGAYDHIQDQAVQELCSKITIDQQTMPNDNDLQTIMNVTFEDGETVSKTLEKPKWQEPERPPTNEEVARKFKSLAPNFLDEARATGLVEFVTGPFNAKVAELIKLAF